MKLATVIILMALSALAGPAMAQTVNIDYDSEYDPSGNKTFSWVESPKTSLVDINPLLHSRILNGIEYYLTLGGLSEVEENPDVYVTYHASTSEQLILDSTNMGYGYPGGWGMYGGGYRGGYRGGYVGTTTTTVRSYQTGTLVVDVWDAKSEKLVWRGTATNISVSDNPTKMKKKIDKALKKMTDKWAKIKKKNLKKAGK